MKNSIKTFGFTGLLFALLLPNILVAQGNIREKKMEWWEDAKFGMFIHWGLYSKTAGFWKGKPAKGSEHFMLYERIPLKEYGKIPVVSILFCLMRRNGHLLQKMQA